MKRHFLTVILVLLPLALQAQQVLTLEDCRQMAVSGNQSLEMAASKVEMAHCDKAVAFANYFPNISAKGAYLYNSENLKLISDETSQTLQNYGTAVQSQLNEKMQGLTQLIASNPQTAMEYMQSPMWQTVLGALSQTDIATPINQIGATITDALNLDVQNVYAGVINVTQPVFTGGKIIASNKVAKLAEELAQSQYDTEYQKIMVDVDQAYWQIVSIAAKKELAQNYYDLLEKMRNDAEISAEAGVATESDVLTIKVKASEAKMTLAKATNGLTLAKMLLCKQIGLPLDSDIKLADEGGENVPMPQITPDKPMDQVYEDRAEIHSLDLAKQIYDGKVAIARADMMPTVALTANYLLTNPNMKNGFQNEFGGMFTAGVVVNVPIFHGFEALQKTRKAKAEATMYATKFEDTKNLVNLEVSKYRAERTEALDRLSMAEENLDSAEENLRTAMVGFEAGVVDTNTTLAAQTAWHKAHSEYIDAGIELQMTAANIARAEGNYKAE